MKIGVDCLVFAVNFFKLRYSIRCQVVFVCTYHIYNIFYCFWVVTLLKGSLLSGDRYFFGGPRYVRGAVTFGILWYYYCYSPGWDDSPSQVAPQHFCQVAQTIRQYRFILLGGERHCESVLSKNTTQWSQPVLEPKQLDTESNALIIRPPRLLQQKTDLTSRVLKSSSSISTSP